MSQSQNKTESDRTVNKLYQLFLCIWKVQAVSSIRSFKQTGNVELLLASVCQQHSNTTLISVCISCQPIYDFHTKFHMPSFNYFFIGHIQIYCKLHAL